MLVPGMRNLESNPIFLRAYYWATPLFAAGDLLLGVPLRAAALPSQKTRLAYYALCLGCAALIHLRPRTTALVGLIESSVNILLLILAVYLPTIAVLDTIETGEVTVPILTPLRLANLALSAYVLYRSFLISQLALTGERRRR